MKVGVITFALFATACAGRTPTSPSPIPLAGTTPIMGTSRLSASQLASWFAGRQPQPAGAYVASVPVSTLAQYFIEEGAAEGVTGDIAFVQSIIETGWFRFEGSVPPSANNFAGIGATDTGAAPAMFLDARTGVRAQIQHLRAYADPGAITCTVPPLHNPCVDPRFQLVLPKGKASTWNALGSGNWATSASYGTSILSRYEEAKQFSGVP